jgi:selenocysteine lyase/cysteine desulfurase
MPDEEKLAAVREGLPATAAGIYLNTGTCGPIPREAAVAMAELEGWELATGRAHAAFQEEALVRLDEARAAIAAIVHADIGAIALTHGTTDGVNAALWSIEWAPGDVLVTTNLEYPGVVAAIRSVADRRGVSVRTVEISPDEPSTLAAFEHAIEERTRMVVLSHVVWSTGERLPVEGVVRVCHAAISRPLVVVDGAQSVGAIPIDVQDLGVDFLAIPAQKWLLGPEGMGALFVSSGILDRVRPAFVSWLSLRDELDASAGLWPNARRFESSNFHSPSVVGMARACGWLSMYVGLDWVHGRAAGLARGAFELLAQTPGVELITPADRLATLVVFRIRGWQPNDALEELGRRTFVIARTIPARDAIRISLGFFNSEAEVGRFCEAVAEIGRHTPETLPRKPALTILGEG